MSKPDSHAATRSGYIHSASDPSILEDIAHLTHLYELRDKVQAQIRPFEDFQKQQHPFRSQIVPTEWEHIELLRVTRHLNGWITGQLGKVNQQILEMHGYAGKRGAA